MLTFVSVLKEYGMDWENIKNKRFESLTEQIEFFLWRKEDGLELSTEQIRQITELRQVISVFGEKSDKWVELCNELLTK